MLTSSTGSSKYNMYPVGRKPNSVVSGYPSPTSIALTSYHYSHCQVDRLMAMWQATHPGVNLAPEPRSPTFALGGAGPDDLFTPLYPFRTSSGREWTTDQVKTAQSIFSLGYSYPEVPQGRSQADLQAFTAGRINALYGPLTSASTQQRASFSGARSGAPESMHFNLTIYQHRRYPIFC